MVMQSRKTSRPLGDGFETILKLKGKCHFQFFNGSRFPLQANKSDERCYVFKMSTIGLGSGVEIAHRMDSTGDGDLWHSWVCFDYVYRLENGWHTMGAHVYDHMCVFLFKDAPLKMILNSELLLK